MSRRRGGDTGGSSNFEQRWASDEVEAAHLVRSRDLRERADQREKRKALNEQKQRAKITLAPVKWGRDD